MLTREQAAETWCPMVRITRHIVVTIEGASAAGRTPAQAQHHVVAGLNADDDSRNPSPCRCIADKCAMWRWADTKQATRHVVVESKHGPCRFREETRLVTVPDTGGPGYCGLAGSPLVAGGNPP